MKLKCKKTGLLLVNLGTPDAATLPAVRRYLREFLSDPYVVDLPALLRWMLLNVIILPFRTRQSTQAYQQIWTEQGSPLLIHSNNLTKRLQSLLNEAHYCVALGMRYGRPSIESAVKRLLSQGIEAIKIIPLYPQYSEATTESSIQKTKAIIQKYKRTIPIQFINDFYDHPHYIMAKAQLIKNTLADKKIDKLLFSYHGLPQRSIHRVCSQKECNGFKKSCPRTVGERNSKCYRAQCYATSHQLAKQLGLEPSQYIVTFQSRLGKVPWITPYTELVLNELAQQGLKNIAIVCPSFVVDCLETLEEIDIRAQLQWRQQGGVELIRVPCLNDDATWIKELLFA